MTLNVKQVFNAVHTNDFNFLRNNLSKEMLNCTDEQGNTPLMLAAGLGHTEIVEWLLDNAANVHVVDNKCGYSALHLSCQNGSIEMTKLLISAGAHLNQQIVCNGMTPLMNAVWYRKPQVVEYLLSLPSINTAIHAHFGATAEDLINASSVSISSSNNQTAVDTSTAQLSHAFTSYYQTHQQSSLISTLLTEGNNLEDNPQTLQKIKIDSKQINIKTSWTNGGNDLHTALHIAARDGMVNIVKTLLQSGAEVAVEDGYMFSTPLHKAAYMGHEQVILALAFHPNFTHILNKQGPCNGYTALHDATWHGHHKAVSVLLELGADKDIKGFDGKTAYDLATEYAYPEIQQHLKSSK